MKKGTVVESKEKDKNQSSISHSYSARSHCKFLNVAFVNFLLLIGVCM